MRKTLLTLLAIVLAGVGATSCGVSESARSTPPLPDSDGPNDNPSKPEEDDNGTRYFGREADAAETLAVAGLVKRYYAAGAAGDGATACSLIYSVIARSVPEEYGRPPGPPALRGNTCAAVMSKLFKQRHGLLLADLAKLSVADLRVGGERAVALLSFGRGRERYIPVRRERRVWKIDELFDAGFG
jgi:hypothetical protein